MSKRVYTDEFKKLLQEKASMKLTMAEMTREMNNAFPEFQMKEQDVRSLITRNKIKWVKPENARRRYTKEFKTYLQEKASLGLTIDGLVEEMDKAYPEYHLTAKDISNIMSNAGISRKKPEKRKRVLTSEERIFAEKNHNLIYSFINKYHLDENDWYDLAAIGYLEAVMDWHRKGIKGKYPFSSVAYLGMQESVRKYWRYLMAKKRPSEMSSIDREMPETGTAVIDMVVDVNWEQQFRDIEFSYDIGMLMGKLTDRQKKILILLYNGYLHKEIAMLDKDMGLWEQWKDIKDIRSQMIGFY